MPAWEAGGRKQCLSTCYLGVGVCVATWQGYWVWHLRGCLGTLNVLYRRGQSRKRELSPAHDNQQCPQIETLFKCLGLTSQEAIRGGGKGTKSRWPQVVSPRIPSTSYCCSPHSPYHHLPFAWVFVYCLDLPTRE